MNTPATTRLLGALQQGESLTSRQIEARYNVARGRKVVENLRLRGYVINTVETENSKGERRFKFELGHPTQEMIAAAYRYLGLGASVQRLSA